MTGYGAATCASTHYRVTVELKSLNSKYLEVAFKLPRVYMKYEHRIRNQIAALMQRGKVTFLLNVEVLQADRRTLNINQALVKKYLTELQALAQSLDIDARVDIPLLLTLPEVIPTEVEQEDPEEWSLIEQAVEQACQALLHSRNEEGQALGEDLKGRVAAIHQGLQVIQELAPARLEAIRERIGQSIEDIRHKVEADQNRFEQELIFYVEKLDINEEIVRLTQHLLYFEELRQSEQNTGKQLQFLAQEMGREINTIGSKANDAGIQRLVVAMKDELERIKEQVFNVV
jgi:uncharacterized protein (TIGR00255 family)